MLHGHSRFAAADVVSPNRSGSHETAGYAGAWRDGVLVTARVNRDASDFHMAARTRDSTRTVILYEAVIGQPATLIFSDSGSSHPVIPLVS